MTHDDARTADPARLSEMFQWFAEIRDKESPLYARLCRAVAADPALLDPLGPLPDQAHLPVLLLTSIHHLALGGAPDRLAAVYRDPGAGLRRYDEAGDEDPARDLGEFVTAHAAEMAGLIATRRTQTNEVNRSAVIAPAMRVAARLAGGPTALVEVGTSAGLNLQFDRFAVRYSNGELSGPADSPVQLACELRGELTPPLVPNQAPVSRTGLDLDPIDVQDEDRVRWLRACLFPDQPDRAARLASAVGVAREHGTRLHGGDLFEVLPRLVEAVPESVTPVVMHTWVLAYLPDRLGDFAALLTDLARRRGRPLLWLGAEWPDALPGREKEPDDEGTVYALAEVDAESTVWHTLANSHDHGTWMTWRYRG